MGTAVVDICAMVRGGRPGAAYHAWHGRCGRPCRSQRPRAGPPHRHRPPRRAGGARQRPRRRRRDPGRRRTLAPPRHPALLPPLHRGRAPGPGLVGRHRRQARPGLRRALPPLRGPAARGGRPPAAHRRRRRLRHRHPHRRRRRHPRRPGHRVDHGGGGPPQPHRPQPVARAPTSSTWSTPTGRRCAALALATPESVAPGLSPRPGVYAQVLGPQFETPAEVAHAAHRGRRRGGHVDGARDHRRPARRGRGPRPGRGHQRGRHRLRRHRDRRHRGGRRRRRPDPWPRSSATS